MILRRPCAALSALALLLLPAALATLVLSVPAASATPLTAAALDARVDSLLALMTLDEKVSLLSGVNNMDLPAIPRLGIPSLRMTDGPVGVRLDDGHPTTAFPAAIAAAASFDDALASEVAAGMGEEVLALGRDVLLGPCVNIARVPQGGRNFESFGEDPYLAARLAASWVGGLQSRGALACVKHLAANNQETRRNTVNVRVSERALQELCLPAFHAAVRAGTWGVMSSYNRVNGDHASQNAYLQDDVLKRVWGFRGFVVSDWGGTHSTVPAANHGLDVEMPSGEYFGRGQLQACVRAGTVSASTVDDKARRVLRAILGGGVMDRARGGGRPDSAVVGGAAHRELALRQAREGIVLLRNDGILPLRARRVAVIGPNAAAYAAGGGSSEVPPARVVTALDGLRQRGGAALDVTYAEGVKMPGEMAAMDVAWLDPPSGHGGGHGLLGEYFANDSLAGRPRATRVDHGVDFDWGGGAPARGLPVDHWSVRWTGSLRVPADGEYELATRADDGTRLWVDDRLLIDDWTDHGPVTRSARVTLTAGVAHRVRLEYFENGGGAMASFGCILPVAGGVPEAVAAARAADAVVLVLGACDRLEGEGNDRASLELPDGQEALLDSVAAANPNVVVVLEIGSPVLADRWLAKTRALLQAWYPGQEGGLAIADVLLGRVSPSGHTPITWPHHWEDCPAYGHFPGDEQVEYAEGIEVGYRYFDDHEIEPLFPFGFGLSYARFEYDSLVVDVRSAAADSPLARVNFDVVNRGDCVAAAVPQLYVSDLSAPVPRPKRELKGFARVELAPGESRRVSLELSRDAFAWWSESAHAWTVSPGRFVIAVGASSRDLRLEREIALEAARGVGAP
jgi:beta-glucosidase